CRFGYPKPLAAETSYNNDTGRFVYARGPGDERVNCYNPDLLRFSRSNMDLQYNSGDAARVYMSKYITKVDSIHRGLLQSQTAGNPAQAYIHHFHYRSVGIVEAIMDLCSLHLSRSSIKILFLPLGLVTERPRLVRPIAQLRALPP
ncbi:hypothetical protein BGW39_003509, partial [Mortierella sp. 14UC]